MNWEEKAKGTGILRGSVCSEQVKYFSFFFMSQKISPYGDDKIIESNFVSFRIECGVIAQQPNLSYVRLVS
jgi:hypothetical protein